MKFFNEASFLLIIIGNIVIISANQPVKSITSDIENALDPFPKMVTISFEQYNRLNQSFGNNFFNFSKLSDSFSSLNLTYDNATISFLAYQMKITLSDARKKFNQVTLQKKEMCSNHLLTYKKYQPLFYTLDIDNSDIDVNTYYDALMKMVLQTVNGISDEIDMIQYFPLIFENLYIKMTNLAAKYIKFVKAKLLEDINELLTKPKGIYDEATAEIKLLVKKINTASILIRDFENSIKWLEVEGQSVYNTSRQLRESMNLVRSAWSDDNTDMISELLFELQKPETEAKMKIRDLMKDEAEKIKDHCDSFSKTLSTKNNKN